ncbi:universal stress protein [[Limnothrix rosea] IAM M-220]|uniref:universal stress protein n=1 Tax=[Limnothrix rosea] IAM M-220 TaxID=454133 RepID=UPI0009672689|nr:universal stress protein [[Limnothrix rosea] IAM M-220]OKH12729.1 universal stress protein UspA-like protein [[Limnothrix rosea] IAM M-220]
MFHSALICTDFTDGLDRLTNCIENLVGGGLSKIVFFHSVPLWTEGNIPRIDKEKITEAQSLLSKALIHTPDGADVKVEVISGKPLDNINKVIEEYGCDVIIVGTPIKNLIQEKMFGSTSLGLMKSLKKPVMILRPQIVSTYTREELALRCKHLWRYLLLPYNDSDEAKHLIQQVKQFAASAPKDSLQQCYLSWVLDDSGIQRLQIDALKKDATKKLEAVKAELEEVGLTVKTAVQVGAPLNTIMDIAVKEDISAIAIASKPRNQLLELTIHSFASDLLHRSWFPTLFFPM